MGLIGIVAACTVHAETFDQFRARERAAMEAFRESQAPRANAPATAPDRNESPAVQHLEPSDDDQTLSWPGVTIRVPGGLLSKRTAFTLNRTDGADIPFDGLNQARPLLELTLQTEPALPTGRTLQLIFLPAPGEINNALPFETQFELMRRSETDARWIPTELRADTDARRIIAGLTPGVALRLCNLGFERRAVDDSNRPVDYVACTVVGSVVVGVIIGGHAVYEWAAHDAYAYPRFHVLCDANAIRSHKVVGDKHWTPAPAPPLLKHRSGTPLFVRDVVEYANLAWDVYVRNFTAPPVPLTIKIDSALIKRRGDAGLYDYKWNRIHLNTESQPTKHAHVILKQRVAHELFHAFQDRELGFGVLNWTSPYLLYLESSAQYASCMLPWTLPKRIGNGNFYADMLTVPLAQTDILKPNEGELEYDKGVLVQYLVKHGGVTFKDIVVKGVKRSGLGDPFLPALDSLLRAATTERLALHYRRFAPWYLLSEECPPNFTPHQRVEQLDQIGDPNGAGTVLRWMADLDGGLTTRAWGLTCHFDRNDPLTVEIRADQLEAGCWVDIYHLQHGQNATGQPVPVCSIDDSCRWVRPVLLPDHTLYMLAINPFSAGKKLAALSARPLNVRLDRIEPNRAIPGQKVILHGAGFGDPAAGRLVSVTGGSVYARDADTWTAKRIAITLPEGARPGPVRVIVDGEESNALPLEMPNPLAVNITPHIAGGMCTRIDVAITGGERPYACQWTLEVDGEAPTTGKELPVPAQIPYPQSVPHDDDVVVRPGPGARLTYEITDAAGQKLPGTFYLGEQPLE